MSMKERNERRLHGGRRLLLFGVRYFCPVTQKLFNCYFSVCDEKAAYSALAEANALMLLVPSGDKTAKLVPCPSLGKDDGTCQWSLHYCGLTMQCSHITDPEPSCFVFAGCSVLNFLGLYWSPVLMSLVCPEEQRVIPGASLGKYLHKHDIEDHLLGTLLLHLLSSFTAIAIEDDLERLYDRSLRCISVDRPIPGLQYDEFLTWYRCSECFKWCTSLSGHFIRLHSASLRSRESGQHYFRLFRRARPFQTIFAYPTSRQSTQQP